MTLSTRAEHEQAREIGYVADETESHVNPHTRAEAAVMALEGTEADPAVIDDPEWQARQVADDVEAEATDAARCYTDSRATADAVGREFANDAYDAVLAGLRGAPTVEVRHA